MIDHCNLPSRRRELTASLAAMMARLDAMAQRTRPHRGRCHCRCFVLSAEYREAREYIARSGR